MRWRNSSNGKLSNTLVPKNLGATILSKLTGILLALALVKSTEFLSFLRFL